MQGIVSKELCIKEIVKLRNYAGKFWREMPGLSGAFWAPSLPLLLLERQVSWRALSLHTQPVLDFQTRPSSLVSCCADVEEALTHWMGIKWQIVPRCKGKANTEHFHWTEQKTSLYLLKQCLADWSGHVAVILVSIKMRPVHQASVQQALQDLTDRYIHIWPVWDLEDYGPWGMHRLAGKNTQTRTVSGVTGKLG